MRGMLIFAVSLLFASTAALQAESLSGSVVFSEAGFPAADSAGPSPEQVQKMLPGAQLASAQQLANLLNATSTRLLVLPYGSAFPEEALADIYHFLRRGGNLLVLGGRPFTRSAYRDLSMVHSTRWTFSSSTNSCFR